MSNNTCVNEFSRPCNVRLYTVNFLTSFQRGLYIIANAWIALQLGGSLASVGQIFFAGHIINVMLSPVSGIFIDSYNRKVIAILCNIGLFFTLSLPYFLSLISEEFTFLILLLMTCTSAVFQSPLAGANDGIVQEFIPKKKRPGFAAKLGAVRQSAMVIGAGIGGFVIHWAGDTYTFLFIAFISFFAAVLYSCLPEISSNKNVSSNSSESYFGKIKEGMSITLYNPTLLFLGVVIVMSFSGGQLSNAMLPALIEENWAGGSRLYGIVDAAWAIGGILASIVITSLLKVYPLKYMHFLSLGLLGIAAALFPYASEVWILVAAHGVMGVFFSCSVVLSDGKLLYACPEDMIGRVRTNIQAFQSLFGMCIYMIPTIFQGYAVENYYVVWGLFAIVIACLVFLLSIKDSFSFASSR